MKTISMRKVTLLTRGVFLWSGSFLGRLTRNDVVAAIQCEIDAGHTERVGLEGYDQEDLMTAQEIARHAPVNFTDAEIGTRVRVANTVIGSIKARESWVYVSGEAEGERSE